MESASSPRSVTIFIHGTLFSGITFLKPYTLYQDRLLENRSFRQMHRILRKHPLLKEQQLLLEEGLVPISKEHIEDFKNSKLNEDKAQQAAYSIVSSYAVLESAYSSSLDHDYYVFGWSGILSDRARKDAAKLLYKALQTLKKQYKTDVHFHIVAHSHGGNCALYLPFWETIFKENLSIATVSLFGTPIQPETAQYLLSPLFKAIFNFYSLGDPIQRADIISVKSHTCFRMLREGVPAISASPLFRADISLCYNMQPRMFNHSQLFLLGRSKAILEVLDPLPLVVLTPIIIKECSTLFPTSYHDLVVSMNESPTKNYFDISLFTAGQEHWHVTRPLFEMVHHVSGLTREQWSPTCASRNQVFSTQHTLIAFDALKHLLYN